MKKLLYILATILLPHFAFAVEEEDIRRFFLEVPLDKEAYNITFGGNVEEVETLIVETNDIDEGVYEVSVTRIDDHIYKIDGTSLYIEMPYCYEYSYSDDAIMKVESFMGRKTGTLIFVED